MTQAGVLHFSGHQHFRHRLVLSILSGKPVRIDKLRPEDKNPGLRGQLLTTKHTDKIMFSIPTKILKSVYCVFSRK
jgi:RNA 3'-terminal phosphate cyclase